MLPPRRAFRGKRTFERQHVDRSGESPGVAAPYEGTVNANFPLTWGLSRTQPTDARTSDCRLNSANTPESTLRFDLTTCFIVPRKRVGHETTWSGRIDRAPIAVCERIDPHCVFCGGAGVGRLRRCRASGHQRRCAAVRRRI